jgi:hypothetical protein
MSSDEVNSIGDTVESLQVANIIKQKFFDLIARVPLSDLEGLVQLQSSTDPTKPVLMYVPDDVEHIEWLKYFDSDTVGTSTSNGFVHSLNVDITSSGNSVPSLIPPGYLDVEILSNLDFINMVTDFNPQETNVKSFNYNQGVTGQNYTFYYKTDRTPQYCTILNNKYVVFDAYDSTVDTTLQTTKTMAWGRKTAQFLMQDSFIPPLNDEQFPLLFNESKLAAFFELKQQPHQLADREVKRGWSEVQKNKSVVNKPTYFDAIPNYGRWGRGGWGQPQYFKLRGWDRS